VNKFLKDKRPIITTYQGKYFLHNLVTPVHNVVAEFLTVTDFKLFSEFR